MPVAYLSLGSNLGAREIFLRDAITGLCCDQCRVAAVSRIYETAHVGAAPDAAPRYLNCVVRVDTNLSPIALLDHTQAIEQRAGRERTYPDAPRTLDIDILLYDNETLDTDRLHIPHPRMFDRAFVLIPLMEIAPNLLMPTGAPISDAVDTVMIRAQRISRYSLPDEGAKPCCED